MSTTAATYPIVAAIKHAELILGPDRAWQPTNEMQRRFLTEFFVGGRVEVVHVPEIESMASYSHDEVNAFLRERGFTIQLNPWDPPDFGVASVLDLLVEWAQKGEVTLVKTDDGREFPGVRVDEQGVRFFDVPDHPHPVARLETKSGDLVYVTMLDQTLEGFDLVAKARAFSEHKRPNNAFGGLIFPMVDLNQEEDITWLIDMHTAGDDGLPAIIFQALQQTKLQMNEVGARAQSAAAVQITRGIPDPDHVINRSFLIWFERDGLSQLLFVGHVTPDDWRNPGEIARDGERGISMLIPNDDLDLDFVAVDDQTTGQQALDAAEGKKYVVIKFSDGQYAVLEPSRLRMLLRSWKALDVPLSEVPDQVFANKMKAVIQQDSKDPADLERVKNLKAKELLVVLLDGRVVGLLWVAPIRKVELPKRPPPEMESVDYGTTAGPGTLIPEEEMEESPPEPDRPKPEKRYINAEIEDHDKAEPLQMEEVYRLAIDVDVELRPSAVGGAEYGCDYQADEERVKLTVQLTSDDFEILSGPQPLVVPRFGKSRNKAIFQLMPRHEGEGVINAVFLKDGNFIQLITLKLQVGASPQPGVLTAETLGRPVDAAFVAQPRDVSLTILEAGNEFQLIMSSGTVWAQAKLPVTLPQLDQMIAQARQELQDIVHLEVNSNKVYQTGIDISPKVDEIALPRLAKTGYRLFQRIFYGPDADAQTKQMGDRLREMAQKGPLKIQIFSKQFVLPWGILYMDDKYDADQVDPELFLGLKHIIEHIPLQQDMRVVSGTVDSQPNLTVSLNVNTDIDKQMKVPLIADQKKHWEAIAQSSGTQVLVRETKDKVTQALGDAATPDHILYFYCHAISKALAEGGGPDASTLVLSNKGKLTLGDLYIDAPTDVALPGAPLVFINACESAELSPLFYDGFAPYFMAKGARGVIGTECETPALFAAEWAKRFFNLFLAGKPLGQAFLDLRREFYYDHNNVMGLLYALYCDGDTQVVPGLQMA